MNVMRARLAGAVRRLGERPALQRVEVAIIAGIHVAFVVALPLSIWQGAWRNAAISFAGLVIAWLPHAVARYGRVRLPLEFELLLNAFTFASIILGSINDFYTRYSWWGVLLGYIGLMLLTGPRGIERSRASAVVVGTFTVAFALAAGAVWEIYEFLLDQFLGQAMQNGLFDTMRDLISDAAGGLLVGLAAYARLRFGEPRLGHTVAAAESQPTKP